jgi:putative methyltransferase (TIGR04325 family)
LQTCFKASIEIVILRAVLKELIPPFVMRTAMRLSGRGIRFEGNYRSWRDAQQASGGYDQEDIVRRVFEAECKVSSGEAADERDSVLFDSIQFSLPVMAALARIACMRNGSLRVLDFGGAFGGMYRQYRAFGLPEGVSWNVVEQPEFVRLGRAFENNELRFFTSFEEVLTGGLPDVLLLSSVMQYLEDPFGVLRKIMSTGVSHVVIDRTPFFDAEHDLLTVQRVPSVIYKASYPCWIFSRSSLLRAIEQKYRMVAAFKDSATPWQGPGVKFDLAGFMFDRQS